MTTMIRQGKQHFIIICFCRNFFVKTSSYQNHFALFPGMYKSIDSPTFVQGVPQYCSHFCFVNFSASKAPRNFILDIFQLPFCVDFKNIQFLMISKVNIFFCLLLNQELE